MINITIQTTINGKPIDDVNFENEIEKMLLNASLQSIKEHINNIVSPEEAKELAINFVGEDIENLSIEIKGPEILVQKITDSM